MPEQENKDSKPYQHQVWLEAHYAMGKLEVKQGFILGWRERSEFIKNYIANHSQVVLPTNEIESDKANNQ